MQQIHVFTTNDLSKRLDVSDVTTLKLARQNIIPGATFYTNGRRTFVVFDRDCVEHWFSDGCPGISPQLRQRLAQQGVVSAEEPRNVQQPVKQPADPELAELV